MRVAFTNVDHVFQYQRNYIAQDRLRFQRRISEMEKLLTPILSEQHRKKVLLSRALKNNCIVVDMEGFYTPKFTPKELAISDGLKTNHYVFKPAIPFENLTNRWKQNVRWLENNLHNIPYVDGHVEYKEIKNILKKFTENASCIYVKGYQKKEFLDKILDHVVINLENAAGVPNLTKSECDCFYHTKSSCCSLHNVKILCDFLHLNK